MKIIISLILLLNLSYSAIWSRTSMEIATSAIIPFISARMTIVTTQFKTVNNLYKNKITKENEKKLKKITQIKKIEVEILKTINEIKFLQLKIDKSEKN